MKNIFLYLIFVGLFFSQAALAIECPDGSYVDSAIYARYGCNYNKTKSASSSSNRSRKAASSKPKKTSGKNNNGSSGQQQQAQDSGFSCAEPADVGTRCQSRGWNPIECRCRTQDEAASGANPTNQQQAQEEPQAPRGSNPQLEALMDDCTQQTKDAADSCDQDADSGVQSATGTLSQFAVQAGSMGLGGCSKLATGLAAANGAVATFSMTCDNARSKCMGTCGAARSKAAKMASTNPSLTWIEDQIDQTLLNCKKLDTKTAQATMAIQNVMNSVPTLTTQCKATNPAFQSYCEMNPTALGCATTTSDCSNPAIAASDPICAGFAACKTNPNSAACLGAQAKADANNGAFDASSTASTQPTSGTGNIKDPDFSSLDYGGNGMTPSKGVAEDVGGKKGAGAKLGDGGGGGAPGGGGDGKGGPGGANALAVNAGFRGGGGGGGGWGSGGYSGSSGDSLLNDPKDPKAGGPNGPNLRSFLPNGANAPGNRGLAGVSGPDGITGPNSDLWKKVQNRYRVQVEDSKLMP